MPDNEQDFNVNSILNGLFREPSLRELFDAKLAELKLAPTAALETLEMQYRSLNGILDGTQKIVDFTNFSKLAGFLQISKEKVIELYGLELERNFPTPAVSADKIRFIKENFDLAVLKRAGLINSLTDFKHIEQRIMARLGLRSIFEYQKPRVDVAFSSGIFKPQNQPTRSFWINAAKAVFEEIANPYVYDKQALVEYFPQIRWHSTNVERGLTEVIRNLYKLGVTVIYQPPLQTLRLRGAIFSVNDKPCIVLTNYVGFYATMWFALIHELYHLLFDWEDIKANSYHLTDDDDQQLAVRERENLADDFARKYLFSKEKTASTKRFIGDANFIRDIAMENHIHPSMIYVFLAFDSGDNKMAWARARRFSPTVAEFVAPIDIPWSDPRMVEEIFNHKKVEVYN